MITKSEDNVSTPNTNVFSICECIYHFFSSMNNRKHYDSIPRELHERTEDGYIPNCAPTSGYKGINDVY